MKIYTYITFCIIYFILITGCNSKDELKNRNAPLLPNLGSFEYEVTTKSDLAQKYFNQGLILSYGFNHLEAFRSFNEAAEIDSSFAMAYWGMALVLGPNINAAMESSDIKTAYEAVQKAAEYSKGVTKKEQEFISALSKRYSNVELEDRTSLDSAYAKAMSQLARKYPKDTEAGTLYAESIMDLHPWDYWLKDGTPQGWTDEIITQLENVLEINPEHPGANHLFIHTIEASKNPERGLINADRLRTLIPGAGHLVHMPSHIYIRVGKYHEGTLANQMAVKSDEAYLTQCNQQGLYPMGYYPHNYHFLWATATLEGRSALANDAALKTSSKPADSLLSVCGYQTLQHYKAIPYYAYVRFGKWDDILKAAAPLDEHPYPKGVWHYARGMALIANNHLDKAKEESNKLEKLKNLGDVNDLTIWGINSAGNLLKIASEVLLGEIAAKEKNYNKAIEHLSKAVELEKLLLYDEPPTWFYPVRHNLGAILIEAGKFAEAEKIYNEDLDEFPENGWALFGLIQSLKKQNKNNEVIEVEKRFKTAWQFADIELSSSRII
jgi:tetratricopeptide (TPR) repeat protein